MSARYANVYEAFISLDETHAHGSIANGSITSEGIHDGEVVDPSGTPSTNMKLYGNDGDGDHIATYDGNEWVFANLADVTLMEQLQGLLTSSRGFVFGLNQILSTGLSVATYDNFLYHSVNDFLRATHAIKDAEEINQINSYVKSLQKDELNRLLKLNDKFRNNVLTTKQMYMMVNRDAYRIRSNIRLLMFSILFAAVVMCLMPHHRSAWAQVLIALAILVFFTYTVVHVRRDRGRRFKDFSKFFFAKGDLPEGKSAETDSAEEEEEGEGGGGTC